MDKRLKIEVCEMCPRHFVLTNNYIWPHTKKAYCRLKESPHLIDYESEPGFILDGCGNKLAQEIASQIESRRFTGGYENRIWYWKRRHKSLPDNCSYALEHAIL